MLSQCVSGQKVYIQPTPTYLAARDIITSFDDIGKTILYISLIQIKFSIEKKYQKNVPVMQCKSYYIIDPLRHKTF